MRHLVKCNVCGMFYSLNQKASPDWGCWTIQRPNTVVEGRGYDLYAMDEQGNSTNACYCRDRQYHIVEFDCVPEDAVKVHAQVLAHAEAVCKEVESVSRVKKTLEQRIFGMLA